MKKAFDLPVAAVVTGIVSGVIGMAHAGSDFSHYREKLIQNQESIKPLAAEMHRLNDELTTLERKVKALRERRLSADELKALLDTSPVKTKLPCVFESVLKDDVLEITVSVTQEVRRDGESSTSRKWLTAKIPANSVTLELARVIHYEPGSSAGVWDDGLALSTEVRSAMNRDLAHSIRATFTRTGEIKDAEVRANGKKFECTDIVYY